MVLFCLFKGVKLDVLTSTDLSTKMFLPNHQSSSLSNEFQPGEIAEWIERLLLWWQVECSIPGQVFGCCSFTSLQLVRLHQDAHRPVTVCTHGDFIVLPHGRTGPQTPWHDIPFSHIILTLSKQFIALP